MGGYSSSIKERMLYSSCKSPCLAAVEEGMGIEIVKKVSRLLILTPPGCFFLSNSCGEKNGGKLAENSNFPDAGDRSRDLLHSGQVSEPLHYGDGLANPKNLLTIFTRTNGESRLIRAPCITYAVLLSYI